MLSKSTVSSTALPSGFVVMAIPPKTEVSRWAPSTNLIGRQGSTEPQFHVPVTIPLSPVLEFEAKEEDPSCLGRQAKDIPGVGIWDIVDTDVPSGLSIGPGRAFGLLPTPPG